MEIIASLVISVAALVRICNADNRGTAFVTLMFNVVFFLGIANAGLDHPDNISGRVEVIASLVISVAVLVRICNADTLARHL